MTLQPPPAVQSPALRAAPPWGDPFWQRLETTLQFTIIGAAKSGTSWLYGLLRQHPRLFIPNEQNFFTTNQHLGPAKYDALYADQPADVLRGDYSTSYMLDPSLPQAFAHRFPGIKVIMVCRHPVDRAFSHYLHDIRQGDLDADVSFEAALAEPPQFSYFAFGHYMEHIRRWLDHIDRDRLMAVLFDDLISDPTATVRRIFGFLGVDPGPEVDVAAANRNQAETQRFHDHAVIRRVRRAVVPLMGERVRRVVEPIYYRGLRLAFGRGESSRPEMAPETRRALLEAYRASNAELGRFLGVDLAAWER